MEKIRVVLPEKYDLVVGDTFRLFFRGVVEAPNPFCHDIACVVETEEPVKRVWLPLDGQELSFTREEGSIHFTVPQLLCYNTAVLEY